jgi:hypothetical protein
MFGFAQEYRIGRAPGKMSNHGIGFDAIYGETADLSSPASRRRERPSVADSLRIEARAGSS